MVSQDTPSNQIPSNMVHQFIIPDSITRQQQQTQFENPNFDAYGHPLRTNNNNNNHNIMLPHSLTGTLPSIEERISRSMNLVHQSHPIVAEESEISHTRHLMDLLGAETNHHHNHHHHHPRQQRLSLSLGSQMLVPLHCKQRSLSSDVVSPSYFVNREDETREEEACNPNYGLTSSSMNSFVQSCYPPPPPPMLNSRYLRAAQTLLEEVVRIGGKEVDESNEKLVRKLLYHGGRRRGLALSSELEAELFSNNTMSSTEKHELQIKFAKLVSLLEEVEGRYEKYYHEMEAVVSSFEVIAGFGAAKSYTGLALQAMSRHFVSLRDAIVSQINVTRRKLCQDIPKISAGISQLSLLDKDGGRHNNRTSLQQLGLIQSQRQAWRPIRGLPETSVTILRSWLFEHFLHPYPNEAEKLILASQTGLSKNQISNWFINARVRLWKPMIEEMYKEEFADSSEDSNPLFANLSTTREGVIIDHVED